MTGWQQHIEAAERELGLDPDQPWTKDMTDDETRDSVQAAQAHALIAIAMLLDSFNDR